MSEVISEFFDKKSFKSLPKLAFVTWFFVFVTDAVFLQHIASFVFRVVFVWVIGILISFLLEFNRFRNMDELEKSQYTRFFLILNTFIIFLYASSYTGLTKQIGAWGEWQSDVNQGNEIKKVPSVHGGFFLLTAEWALPIFANQTSYFPDVAVLAENKNLKTDNESLNKKVIGLEETSFKQFKLIGRFVLEIDSCNDKIERLKDSLDNKDCNIYIDEIKRLRNDSANAQLQIARLNDQFIQANEELAKLRNDSKNTYARLNNLIERIQKLNSDLAALNRIMQIQCVSNQYIYFARNAAAECKQYSTDVKDLLTILSRLKPVDIK